jgi:hypothetical protein
LRRGAHRGHGVLSPSRSAWHAKTSPT